MDHRHVRGDPRRAAVDVDRDVGLTVRFDRLFTLTVMTAGDVTGVVTAPDGVVACPDVCAAQLVEGTMLELSATPDADVEFGAWAGDCSGTSPRCEVTLDRDRKYRIESRPRAHYNTRLPYEVEFAHNDRISITPRLSLSDRNRGHAQCRARTDPGYRSRRD